MTLIAEIVIFGCHKRCDKGLFRPLRHHRGRLSLRYFAGAGSGGMEVAPKWHGATCGPVAPSSNWANGPTTKGTTRSCDSAWLPSNWTRKLFKDSHQDHYDTPSTSPTVHPIHIAVSVPLKTWRSQLLRRIKQGFLLAHDPIHLSPPSQTAIRKYLGLHNNDDMFLNEIHPFLAHYLPTDITDDEANKCISGMLSERSSILKKTGQQLSWTSYHEYKPAEFTSTENVTFQPLGKIIEKIMKHNPRNPTKKLHFRLCPNNWLVSDIDGGNFKIDACFTEILQKDGIQNRYIYVPIELKQERTASLRTTVHQQILGACHHILNEDPRRMWIFGLTFENDVVSVWYFSRSHSVKTFAANWLEDPRLLVKIILSLMNAEHSALGVDPMVHLGPESDDKQTLSYVYEVPREIAAGASVFYKTGQIRSPARPMCIAGRVTRVWEVTQVTAADGETEVNPGKKAILKDVWLAAGTSTETENVDKIFEAVDTFVSTRLEAEIRDELNKNPGTAHEAITSNPQTMKRLTKQLIDHEKRFQHFDDVTKERLRGHLTDKNYRAMFLTKLYDWKGLTSKELESSAQSCPNLFPKDPDRLTDDNYMGTKASSARKSTVRSNQAKIRSGLVRSMTQSRYATLTKQDAQNSRGYASKQQIRVVYEEVCESLYEVGTLGDVVDILCQAIDATHILYAVGWVHRDLSAGNILAIKAGPNETWTVKLADFEFARPMTDDQRKVRSDPRTGTAFFMPTEILDRCYLYECSFRDDDSESVSVATPFDADVDYTLAHQFRLSNTDPAYEKFKELDPISCLGPTPVLPPDANPSKILPRGSVVNHNFQHDLESVWWMLLWFITMNVNCAPSFDWGHRVFVHDVEEYEARYRLFNARLDAKKPTLSGSLRQELVPAFPRMLEGLRSQMVIEYTQREIFGHLEVPESYSQIHGKFSLMFRLLAEMAGDWRELEIKCGVNPRVMDFQRVLEKAEEKPIATGSKHGRDEDEPRTNRSGMQYWPEPGNKKAKMGN